MKKILILLAFVTAFGASNVAFAVEEPVEVDIDTEEVQEEIITEESEVDTEEAQEEIITEEEEAVIEEEGCPHTWGEWVYDLTEHDDGSITHFRYCDCGAYEELDVETYCDSGGQYDDCEKGRHNWCEDGYCEECGYTEAL